MKASLTSGIVLSLVAVMLLAGCTQGSQTPTPAPTELPATANEPTYAPTYQPTLEPTVAPTDAMVKVDSVTVGDQKYAGSTVTVEDAYATDGGWMTIHANQDSQPGDVIGTALLQAGGNQDVVVTVDKAKATSKLYAMLHIDAGEMGVYEFPGADVPLKDKDGMVVMQAFMVTDEHMVIDCDDACKKAKMHGTYVGNPSAAPTGTVQPSVEG